MVVPTAACYFCHRLRKRSVRVLSLQSLQMQQFEMGGPQNFGTTLEILMYDRSNLVSIVFVHFVEAKGD